MNKLPIFTALTFGILLFAACQQTPAPNAATPETAKPDMAKVKADIQTLETEWAAAINARNAEAVLAFYADDAISMSDDKPMFVGKAAMREDSKTWFEKNKEGDKVVFETMDLFGDDNRVTETGKTTVTNAAGQITYTGKYMAVWEKRNGKWLTIRDISNDDAKEKQ